jgi:hypothetical protein
MTNRTRTRAVAAGAAALTAGAILALALSQRGAPRRANASAPPNAVVTLPVEATNAATASALDAPARSLVASAPGNSPQQPPASFDEPELMRLLRSARGNDPALAVELAREGNRRFPNSPEAAERASILIHSLADEGLGSQARGEAEDMVNRYPDSPLVQEIERFTGAHRHRNVRVDAEGRLEFYDPPPT